MEKVMDKLGKMNAKELLKKYKFNTFYMGREIMQDYNKYKEYKISHDLELQWIHEYQRDLIEKCNNSEDVLFLNNAIFDYCLSKSNYPNTNDLNELIVLIKNKIKILDSFTKMRLAEDVLERIVRPMKVKGLANCEEIVELQNIAKKILFEILETPIHVNAGYFHSKSILKETFSDENIINRVKSKLREWGEFP